MRYVILAVMVACACESADEPPKMLGDACEADAECPDVVNPGACVDWACTNSCDVLDVASCPDGLACEDGWCR